jgi:hypothetical protein
VVLLRVLNAEERDALAGVVPWRRWWARVRRLGLAENH